MLLGKFNKNRKKFGAFLIKFKSQENIFFRFHPFFFDQNLSKCFENFLIFSCPEMNIRPLNYEKYRKKSIGYPLWIFINFEKYSKSANQMRISHFFKLCIFDLFFFKGMTDFCVELWNFFTQKLKFLLFWISNSFLRARIEQITWYC